MQPFDAVLIANRGEVASRVIRACRHLGIRSVAVASDVDLNLAYVEEADEAVAIGGSSAAQSYLDIDKIIAAALQAGVDAIHPGYGFLAESPAFAEAVETAGLKLVGPSSDAMKCMGNKTEAKRIAVEAGVPVLEGAILGGSESESALSEAGAGVGYPLLVKAAAGGGGRGMRLVQDPTALVAAVQSAGREADAAFGDGSVFIERYLSAARHIEVQIIADNTGTVLWLGDRDCSLQRRHQKVIEEAPAPGLSQELRTAMADAAISLAKSIDYEGLGTVEYLVQGEEFFFLEMNTRLQVEHPVTEEVTGLDLVALQLGVASGKELPISQEDVSSSGHAIEVRLCAEDPRADFLPASGRISCVEWASGDARIEQTYFSGDEISSYYDSLVAKVIVHRESRTEARSSLEAQLRRLRFHGPAVNRDLLVTLLSSPLFDSGRATTTALEGSLELCTVEVGPSEAETMMVFALACGVVPQRSPNLGHAPVRAAVKTPQGESFRVQAVFESDTVLRCSWGDQTVQARVFEVTSGAIRFGMDGQVRTYLYRWEGERLWINAHSGQSNVYRGAWMYSGGSADQRSQPVAPVQGTVLKVEVSEGDLVVEGQVLLTLEAMKMEHMVSATQSGVVDAVLVEPGVQVAAGTTLVKIVGSDPS